MRSGKYANPVHEQLRLHLEHRLNGKAGTTQQWRPRSSALISARFES